MADQQLRGNKIERVFKVRALQSLRKHFGPSKMKYFTICKYCLSVINYRTNYSLLLKHLTMYHPEVLTEEQKTERNIHWVWDYFTSTSYGGQCNICSTRITSGISNMAKHLNIHRKSHEIFDPEVIYEDTYMYGASTSASGSMIVEVYQETSIPIASNLTNDTDRTCVFNESATKTSEPSEYVASPLENIENIIGNVKFDAELKPLDDPEEVAGREELPDGEELPDEEELPDGELPDGEKFLEVEGLIELFDQQPSNIYNYPLDPESQITYDLTEKNN